MVKLLHDVLRTMRVPGTASSTPLRRPSAAGSSSVIVDCTVLSTPSTSKKRMAVVSLREGGWKDAMVQRAAAGTGSQDLIVVSNDIKMKMADDERVRR